MTSAAHVHNSCGGIIGFGSRRNLLPALRAAPSGSSPCRDGFSHHRLWSICARDGACWPWASCSQDYRHIDSAQCCAGRLSGQQNIHEDTCAATRVGSFHSIFPQAASSIRRREQLLLRQFCLPRLCDLAGAWTATASPNRRKTETWAKRAHGTALSPETRSTSANHALR